MGANDEKAGHGPEEKGVRSGRSSRTNWQGGEGEANKIPVEMEVLCIFFSKGPTTIEISQKLTKESDIFYEKGERSGDHQRQIGKEGRRKQDH